MPEPTKLMTMSRFGRWRLQRAHCWGLLVIALLAALCLTFWFACVEPFDRHRQWNRRVQADILALARKRPPGVSKGQWEFAVGWTANLHGNCAGFHTWVDAAWPDEFATELE